MVAQACPGSDTTHYCRCCWSWVAGDAFQALASTFSHELHLDKDRMERETGHHTGCVDTCHKGLESDEAGKDRPKLPTHAACIECHEANATVKAKLPMDNCAGCHL